MKEEDLSFIDLEMLEFFYARNRRQEESPLIAVAEAVLKKDPNLAEATRINRELIFGKRK